MTSNLAQLSLAELQQLAAEVGVELKQREHEKVADAKKQILAIAQSVGMDVKDLIRKESTPMISSRKIAAMYRNPANSKQEWSGRGRRPKWVEILLAEGKSLAELGV